MNSDGSPVGYSPCRPLHYVVNASLAPDGAAGLVPLAIREISRVTGIRFVDDGATDEQPSDQRAPYQPEAYGDRWAPLLISWTTPDAAPKLGGKVIGTGGSTHYSYGNGPKSYVTGSLELDAPQMAIELERPDGTGYATAVILHELGHVMGLEHVNDPVQLMYPEIGAPDGLAAGDLNGLYQLGKTPCRKDL
ncbi:matrixin family metalloprotease [Arthrobacter sp. NPDC056493]|uniref:matrixin family metalloprotease n=1 Tax=Arthrobacter sp. NPDC056493 TaxID=3345839 RepID=UPI00366CE64F